MAIAVLTATALVVLATLAITTARSGASTTSTTWPANQLAPGLTPVPPPTAKRRGCLDAIKAIRYYSSATHEWQRKREASRLADRIRWPNCDRAREAARKWKVRAAAARARYLAWIEHEYHWQKWLPSNWRRLGACETGYGQEPGNWQHDSGTYVSAFGIYRPGYRDDAHRIGNLSWDETLQKLKRYPTPREQYEAGLSHYGTHGDGWGCPGP